MTKDSIKYLIAIAAFLVTTGLLAWPTKGLPERVSHVEVDVAVLKVSVTDMKDDLKWIRNRMERNGRMERIEERDGRTGHQAP